MLARVVFGIWFRLRTRGLEHIPASGGGLLVMNHQSYLDPLVVGTPMSRTVSFLARDSLFRVPIVGWMLRHTYVVPINREAAGTSSIKQSVRYLEHGFLVGIFPEGTRSRDGKVQEFKPGFVTLVRRSGAPVYPVGVAGTHEAMPRGAWFVRPRAVRIVYGEPISPEELAPYSEKGREAELVELVRSRVIACQEDAEAWRRGE
jgi:1-acyl-sn-glycerol-3-phosphate acyltransferase